MVSKEQIKDMLHALGNIKIRKDWKPKTILDKCYRNRYVDYEKNDSLQELVKLGLMGVRVQKQSHIIKDDLYFYYVTEKGIEFLQKNPVVN